VHAGDEDAERRRPRMRKAQVQGPEAVAAAAAALAERPAELGAVNDVAADAVRPAEQRLDLLMSPAASAARTAELETRVPCTS
jgi:hypothetical protein